MTWKEAATRIGFHMDLDADGNFLHLRAIQGHSGGNKVGLSLQDNVGNP